jgi:exopolysaccharide production protein ExoQ
MTQTAKAAKTGHSEIMAVSCPRMWSRFSYFAAVLFLIFCSQPALTNITAYDVNKADEIAMFLFQYVAYIMIIIAIGTSWGAILKQLFSRRMLWIMPVTVLAFVSAAWSDLPAVTIRRAGQLLLTEMVAVYFAMSLSRRQQLRVVTTTLLILLGLSLIAVIVNPAYGTMPKSIAPELAGNWRGIFPHKNALGRYASLAAVIFVLNWLEQRRRRWLLAILFSLGILAGSKSVTSIAVTAAVLLSLLLFRFLRGRSFYSALAVTGLLLVAGIQYLFNNFYSVVNMMGRDVTLTGRLPLWFAGIAVGLRRNPWFGYGWADFWRGYDGDSADVWKFVHWQAPNIHNGFLELWLTLGFLGLICFGLCHLVTGGRAIRLQRSTRYWEDVWPLAFIVYFTLQNLAESIGVSQNSLIWILYVMVVYQVYDVIANQGDPLVTGQVTTPSLRSVHVTAPSAMPWGKREPKAEGSR